MVKDKAVFRGFSMVSDLYEQRIFFRVDSISKLSMFLPFKEALDRGQRRFAARRSEFSTQKRTGCRPLSNFCPITAHTRTRHASLVT